jgi:hypothetical protein
LIFGGLVTTSHASSSTTKTKCTDARNLEAYPNTDGGTTTTCELGTGSFAGQWRCLSTCGTSQNNRTTCDNSNGDNPVCYSYS